MTLVLLIMHHGHEQRLAGPAQLHQHAPLEQDVVLAVTVAVIGVGPAFNHTPVFNIG